MMLICIPIHLFSLELSFATLELDLRVKEREKRRSGMSEVDVFKNIRASSLSRCVLSAAQTAQESLPLFLVSFLI